MMPRTDDNGVADLLQFIGDSPSPWHAGSSIARRLRAAGATELDEAAETWDLEPGERYFCVRGDSSVIAFHVGSRAAAGLRMVGAHTDSPGFRVKPSGATVRNGHAWVGLEVYGGPIIATFADRDLTLAGRAYVESENGLECRLVDSPEPIVRLPNAAIHLNRAVNTDGLRFRLQDELGLVFGPMETDAEDPVGCWVARSLDVAPENVRGWDLAVADTQPGTRFGPEAEYIASSQLDNLASCHAALDALLAVEEPDGIALFAGFDHEEVGSETFKGAGGRFLEDVIDRICAALALRRAPLMQRSWLLSADMAHGWHPGFAGLYDDANAPVLNRGPVIKINAKQRYATDGAGEAYFASLCDRAGVPVQRYVHRGDLPCGSTIGPMTSARLGVPTVDVGNAMWAMHSIRESAGAQDHGFMTRVLGAFYGYD